MVEIVVYDKYPIGTSAVIALITQVVLNYINDDITR